MRRVEEPLKRSFIWLSRSSTAVLIGACVSAGFAPSARAALGQTYTSVEADRVHLSAKMASTRAAAQTVHVLTSANGAVVKEFTASNGVVFAVSWRGPGRADLRQLLGDRFETLQADNVHVHGRRTRAPLVENRSDFVVRTGGHPGVFWGLAYLPAQLPTGVSVESLR